MNIVNNDVECDTHTYTHTLNVNNKIMLEVNKLGTCSVIFIAILRFQNSVGLQL